MALRDLLAVFDIDTGDAENKLGKLDSGLNSIAGKLEGAISAFGSGLLVSRVSDFVKGQLDVAAQINNTAARLGLGTQELQQFQFAAGAAGVDAEGAAHSLMHLNKAIGEAVAGGEEQAKAFQKLGVTVKGADGQVRPLSDMLPELADGFAKLPSVQEQTATAMSIFGRQGAMLIPVLSQGSAGLEKLRQRFEDLGGGVSEDFLKKAKDARKEVRGFTFAVDVLKSEVALGIMPWLTKWAGKLSDVAAWLVKLTRTTNVARELWAVLGVVAAGAGVKMALSLGRVFGLLPAGNVGLLKMLTSLGWIAIAAVSVAVLALVFEDLYTWINGGTSVLGDFIAETYGIDYANELAQKFRDSWDQIVASFTAAGPALQDLGKLLLEVAIAAAPYLIDVFLNMARVITAAIILVGSLVEAIAKIPEAIKQADLGVIGNVFTKAGAAVFGDKGILNPGANVPGDGSPTVPRSQVGGGAGGNSTTINQTNKNDITVDGAEDPQATAKAISNKLGDALGAQLQDAFASSGGGD